MPRQRALPANTSDAPHLPDNLSATGIYSLSARLAGDALRLPKNLFAMSILFLIVNSTMRLSFEFKFNQT